MDGLLFIELRGFVKDDIDLFFGADGSRVHRKMTKVVSYCHIVLDVRLGERSSNQKAQIKT